jgi:uncharacterized protein YjbI with pentapeptide repeats
LPPDANILLLDDPSIGELIESSTDRLVVFATSSPWRESHVATYSLAPWGDDERIEYLLAVHKDRCASVMARLQAEDRPLFAGLPDVWQVVLDLLADDESIPDARSALHVYLKAQLPDADLVERAGSACLNVLAVGSSDETQPVDRLAKEGFPKGLVRVLRHPAVQLLLASERVAANLRGDADCDYLALRLPRDLVRAIAADIAGDTRAREHLTRLLAGPPWSHAMSASILHALAIGWLPDPGCIPVLAGAYLDQAKWPLIQLPGADLRETDLSAADLRGVNLKQAVAHKINLSGALLRDAFLEGFQATEADLSEADLSSVQAAGACFDRTNLRGANLEDARLTGASFLDANLTAASCRGAELAQAILLKAIIKDADFTAANLEGACLTGVPLQQAVFAGARFSGANLVVCDLEYMELPAADFANANLEGAFLTGSSMPNADFSNACLRGTRLAEVNWESACLRGADLSGATFHMGSSRSGLIFSPIASEGSRTGFYTDDYEEQYFKAPEEVRKANLCGADLRGARLDDVDFYLVDLRGALYDANQEQHFRRCRAILQVRV